MDKEMQNRLLGFGDNDKSPYTGRKHTLNEQQIAGKKRLIADIDQAEELIDQEKERTSGCKTIVANWPVFFGTRMFTLGGIVEILGEVTNSNITLDELRGIEQRYKELLSEYDRIKRDYRDRTKEPPEERKAEIIEQFKRVLGRRNYFDE